MHSRKMLAVPHAAGLKLINTSLLAGIAPVGAWSAPRRPGRSWSGVLPSNPQRLPRRAGELRQRRRTVEPGDLDVDQAPERLGVAQAAVRPSLADRASGLCLARLVASNSR